MLLFLCGWIWFLLMRCRLGLSDFLMGKVVERLRKEEAAER